MENLLLPNKIKFTDSKKANEGVFEIEPCYYGYGTTLGNALRRVLLSSLPGAAVTAVKIKGADQEFSAIKDVKEDTLELVLNLKQLSVKVFSEEPVKLTLKTKGKKEVFAKDIEKNSDVEIVNPDLKIATLTDDKGSLEMEITVQQGRGYWPTEERTDEDVEIGTLLVDAIFSPIKNVGYKVENVRVGDITNYDKLVMTIETDGTVTPEEAVKQTAKILIDHFSLLNGSELKKDEEEIKEEPTVESEDISDDSEEK